ncbi:MAG: ABC transporter ATP-binding protein [Candidatus Cryosericum sp.]|nr:ABC transporter ATP-binding protein [bacterium]
MLKIEELHVSYGIIEALHGISIEVETSEIVSILGSNGAGKTTLLKTISGILKPTTGVITVDGVVINSMETSNVVKRGVVHVPEGRHIFPNLTVQDNLILGGYFGSAAQNNENMMFVLNTFPVLRQRLHQKAGMLSGGEQQMLALGRGLMGNPKMLLLDEPSLGLAPIVTSEIFSIVRKLAKEHAFGVLLVEQNARKALEISDRGYVLVNGTIELSGRSEELRENPEVQKLYLGGKNVDSHI